MRWLLFISLSAAVVVQNIVCPPVKASRFEKKDVTTKAPEEDMDFGLEYERYLKEVVSILETDEGFKKKLEESNISDIKTGEISRNLDLVSHSIRTKLDELKRQELDRLRHIQKVNMRRQNGLPLRDMTEVNRLVAHLDHNNPHTFEVEDLSKLIKKATEDLETLDTQRKDEFKQYELEKEYKHKKMMKALDEPHRKEEEKEWDEQKEKHKEHPKLHHPGSKDQLQEVWEESDGLSKDDFDPKTFFMLHDTNGDGMLDPVEIEALFQKELDKIYDPNAPEDDMMERYEEMNLMREHVMKEVDQNGDSFITLEEFLASTKKEDFEKDKGWKTLDDQELFSEDELAQFEKDYNDRGEYDDVGAPGRLDSGNKPGTFDKLIDEPQLRGEWPKLPSPQAVPQGNQQVLTEQKRHPRQRPAVPQQQQQPPPAVPQHQQQPPAVPQHQQQPPAVPQQKQAPPAVPQQQEQPVGQQKQEPVVPQQKQEPVVPQQKQEQAVVQQQQPVGEQKQKL